MENRVLGVLAGNDTPEGMFRFWGRKATIIVAADQGADNLIAAGVFPHVVLGDLDSSALDPTEHPFDFHKFEDQDYSDCDKLLSYIEGQGYSEVTMIGFEGDRIDHVLASLGSFLLSPLNIRIAIRHGLAHVQKTPGLVEYHAYAGQTVSILPIVPSRRVTTSGLAWELDQADLHLGANWSLSNLAKGEAFSIEMEDGALLVVQEYEESRLPEW